MEQTGQAASAPRAVVGMGGVGRPLAMVAFVGALALGLLSSSVIYRDARWSEAIASIRIEIDSAPVSLLGALACAACMGLAFVLTRGRALALAARTQTAPELRGREGARIFAEGTVLECLTWPGKAWADGYRASMLQSCGRTWKEAGLAIARFRVGTLAGVAMVLTLAALPGDAFQAGLALAASGALLLVIALRSRHERFIDADVQTAPRARIIAWGASGSLIDVCSASLVVWAITGVSPVQFAPLYVLVGLASTLSTLPMGVGLAEVGGWWVLSSMLGVPPATAALAVAVYRVAGPGLTLLLGTLSLLARVASRWARASSRTGTAGVSELTHASSRSGSGWNQTPTQRSAA